MVRVCDFSCIKSVWVAQKCPNFPARASRRSQKFLVSLGARAENGELALVKCTKVKSITSILPDLRVSLAAEVTSDRTNSKKRDVHTLEYRQSFGESAWGVAGAMGQRARVGTKADTVVHMRK